MQSGFRTRKRRFWTFLGNFLGPEFKIWVSVVLTEPTSFRTFRQMAVLAPEWVDLVDFETFDQKVPKYEMPRSQSLNASGSGHAE